MAAWPVVLRMHVDDSVCAKKTRKAVEKLRGVESVWASPEQGLVVVHGTADAWALRRRIWRKMKRRAEVVSDGSAPYHYPGTTAAPQYGPSQAYLGWGAPPPHAYYSHPQPPPHAYYSHPPPPGYTPQRKPSKAHANSLALSSPAHSAAPSSDRKPE
nr:heavy metal-associated isoprenylated plant protein 28-like [Lolium perenne]